MHAAAHNLEQRPRHAERCTHEHGIKEPREAELPDDETGELTAPERLVALFVVVAQVLAMAPVALQRQTIAAPKLPARVAAFKGFQVPLEEAEQNLAGLEGKARKGQERKIKGLEKKIRASRGASGNAGHGRPAGTVPITASVVLSRTVMASCRSNRRARLATMRRTALARAAGSVAQATARAT